MRHLWRWLSSAPVVGTEVQNRRAAIQLRVLRFVLLTEPFIIALALLDPLNSVGSVALVWVPMTVALVAMVGVVRRGWLSLAGGLMVATLFVLVTASMVLFGGVMGNNGVGYVIVVMVAGAALSARPALAAAAFCSVAAGVVAIVEHRGLLPAAIVAPSLLNAWIALCVTLMLAAALHHLSTRSLDESLAATSSALAQLRHTQVENETRGLHGAALARLAEQALTAANPQQFGAVAGSLVGSLLSVDWVFVIELDEEQQAAIAVHHGAAPPPVTLDARDTPLAGRPTARILRDGDAGVRPLLDRLLGARVGGCLLAPMRGRGGTPGCVGVATLGPRTFTPEEAQFLETLASLVASLRERDLASERAQRAQKLELVGRLAGSVAHDFNNLLTVVMATSQVLRDANEPTERGVLVDELDGATESARLLTRQLLSFTRKQPVTMSRLDLCAHVEQSLPMLRRLLGDAYTLEARLPAAPCWIDGDRGGLDQVVLNLLVNAREAMPEGGSIFLTIDPRPDGGAVLAVRDHGVGIDAATRQRLFQPFFTTKQTGTGLGLATVADIVARHEAQVDVESAPGAGATFRVAFKAAVGAPARVHAVVPSARAHGRVLLADDHPSVRAGTSRMLESLGFDVLAVGSGAEAFAVLDRDPAFTLLVTDVAMRDVGGRELSDALAKRGLTIPTLFISGYVEDTPTSAIGPSAFLAKPFTRAELGAAATACIDAGRPTRRGAL